MVLLRSSLGAHADHPLDEGSELEELRVACHEVSGKLGARGFVTHTLTNAGRAKK